MRKNNCSVEYMRILQERTFGWEYNAPNAGSTFRFEDPLIFDSVIHRNDHLPVSLGIGAVYIALIFGLQEWMKNKPGWELKSALFLWNLGLGLFSIFGFLRTAPSLAYTVSMQNGFYNSVCVRKYIDISTIYWSCLFIFSKMLELGDTLFIVLRKRPLIFLQWYHHVVTMIYTYSIAMPMIEPVQRWHMTLNFGVHALMYPYFALRGAGVHIPKAIANAITSLQFVQMIIGVVVNVASIYYQYTGRHCVRDPGSIRASFMLYGSFLILFGKLFLDSVLVKRELIRKRVKKED